MSSLRFVVLMLGLLPGCQGIRMALNGDSSSNFIRLQDGSVCPDIKDNENVLFWGMILDGKDHVKGKHVYDWHGFIEAYRSLDFLMQTKPNEPLTYDHLMKARHICCDDPDGKGNFGWATTSNDLEGPVFKSYTCLECDHMKALMDDVPMDLFSVKKGNNPNLKKSPKSCDNLYSSVSLRVKKVKETQDRFKALIETYNTDMEKLTEKEDKLVRLASFLKDFCFLHPWGNGNGRFRTMMLNHEIRRLGLGCGSFMYNNNKDLYFITKTQYLEKIKEGMEMYNQAIATGKSPWTEDAVVNKHKERFDPNITMPGLMSCRKAEYTKTSYYKDANAHEELEDGVNEFDLQ